MHTNQLTNGFFFSTKLQAECLELYQKYAPVQEFSIFVRRFVVIYIEFFKVYELLLTVVRFSEYSFQ